MVYREMEQVLLGTGLLSFHGSGDSLLGLLSNPSLPIALISLEFLNIIRNFGVVFIDFLSQSEEVLGRVRRFMRENLEGADLAEKVHGKGSLVHHDGRRHLPLLSSFGYRVLSLPVGPLPWLGQMVGVLTEQKRSPGGSLECRCLASHFQCCLAI